MGESVSTSRAEQLALLNRVTSPDGPLATRECFPGLDPDILADLEADGLVVSGIRPWFSEPATGWRLTLDGEKFIKDTDHA